MMSQVPAQPQNPDDQQHQMDMQQAAAKIKESMNTFGKLKQIL
jgi:hypothetical protein